MGQNQSSHPLSFKIFKGLPLSMKVVQRCKVSYTINPKKVLTCPQRPVRLPA